MNERSRGSEALAALDVLVGRWVVQILLPGIPPGEATFEWALDGHYLIERSTSPQPEFPDSISVIAPDDAGGYLQHYFDTRGVTRLYRMKLSGDEWLLTRTESDFSELSFWQRFAGRFSADRMAIEGRWEKSFDGGDHWDLDFGMTFARST